MVIIVSWVSASLILGGGFIYVFTPRAGFEALTLIIMGIAIFIMPIAHVYIMRKQLEKDNYNSVMVVMSLLISTLVAISLVLAFTHIFDFI